MSSMRARSSSSESMPSLSLTVPKPRSVAARARDALGRLGAADHRVDAHALARCRAEQTRHAHTATPCLEVVQRHVERGPRGRGVGADSIDAVQVGGQRRSRPAQLGERGLEGRLHLIE
jgi:hypothetical protein